MKCIGCGAEIRFDPASQLLVCDHCGKKLDPEQYGDTEKTASEGKDYMDCTVYKCPQCGASVLTTEETAVTFCSYCGTSVALEGKLSKELRPDYIIPFMKSKKECETLYLKRVRKSLFAPGELKADEKVDKFRGIYMPYWVYQLSNRGNITGTGSLSSRKGDYVYTYHYASEESYKAVYGGLSYDASSAFSDNLSEAIAPFDTRGKKKFNTAYMSGFYGDNRDVKSYVYMDDAKDMVSEDIADRIYTGDGYAAHGITPKSLQNSIDLIVKPESGYFPVWFLANKVKGSDRVSYAVVNGQTGRVAVDIPIDFKKYLLFSLLFAVPIFAILSAFFTLTAKNTLVAAIIITVIGWIFAGKLVNEVYARENQLDDKGKAFIKETKGLGASLKNAKNAPRAPFKEREKIAIKPILGIAAAALVILMSPAHDAWYYGAAVFSGVLTVFTFLDIVKKFNLLTTRKPPQLEKRGGDENA